MSHENVEIVRRALTEFDESQRLSAAFAPNFIFEGRTFRGAPIFEYHGWEGFFEFFEDWVDAYACGSRRSGRSSTAVEIAWPSSRISADASGARRIGWSWTTGSSIRSRTA